MKIIKNIVSFFLLSDDERVIAKNDITNENTRRALYTSVAGIIISIYSISIFSINAYTTNIENHWAETLLKFHLIVLLISMITSITIFINFYLKSRINLTTNIFKNILIGFILLSGIILTAIDQYVTPSITAYIITTLVVGVVFLIPPLIATIIFSLSFILFSYALTITQQNPDVLISNQINGLTMTAMGMFLSFILWRSKLENIKQRKQIVVQNNMLMKSNAEKDKFFSIIAHDLKTPFNSVLGFSKLLEDEVNEKNYNNITKYTKFILTSANKAISLLSNLMEWSRSQTGRLSYNPSSFDLVKTIKETQTLFQGSLNQKQLELILNSPNTLIVTADENMISTVIRNLVSNAIKFSYPHDSIIISLEKTKSKIQLSVSDSGMGIPEDKIDTLFNLSDNYSTLGTQNETGTGLGLILCKEFVEKNNGSIWVESKLGKGSKFIFTIPSNLK